MSLQYIRDYYGVPAEEGERITYEAHDGPRTGTISRATGPHLLVRFDGEDFDSVLHPQWHVTYEGA